MQAEEKHINKGMDGPRKGQAQGTTRDLVYLKDMVNERLSFDRRLKDKLA